MLGLTRWSPFTLHRQMDDLFNRFFGDAWRQSRPDQGDRTPAWWPAVEAYGRNGTLCIRVALPGVDPKDVERRGTPVARLSRFPDPAEGCDRGPPVRRDNPRRQDPRPR